MNNQNQFSILLLALAFLLQLTGCTMKQNDVICSLKASEEPSVAEDELLFSFEVDTDDDIYYISHDLLLDGELMSGGLTGDADGSAISGNLYYTVSPEELWERDDLSQLSIRLYVSDNLDNLEDMSASTAHQDEYAIKNELKINAQYGHTYHIVISGNKTEGYTASLKENTLAKIE